MADDVSVAAVEEALRLAATSMHEQLAAIDQAISYHEHRARELRDTRKKVARVEAIVNAPPDGRRNNGQHLRGGPSAEARARISEVTKQRHAEEREAKKTRLREHVLALPPGAEIAGSEVAAELNDPTMPKNDPARLGKSLANELLRELRDEGTLRVDRVGAGGQAWYRVVGT